jgi:ankyrin repeat protein
MDHLPYIPSSIIWEMLSARDLVSLARTNRLLRCNVEPFLYRRHAITHQRSAVMWAIEIANLGMPETCTKALAVLDKVEQFCHLAPGALDLPCCPRQTYINIQPPHPFIVVSSRHSLYSLTALHWAAWKGLDAIAEWLLRGGANASCGSSIVNPLYLAVLNDKASSALLLLSHGASPVVRPGSQDSLTVLHLACTMGYASLAEQLLASGSVPADPTDVLQCYSTHLSRGYVKNDAPAVVELLARDANVPDAVIGEFLRASRWQSALVLLQAKKRRNRISRTTATDLLDSACSSLRHHTRKAQDASLVIRRLLDMGADPDVGHQLLSSSTSDFPALLTLLPPLLEAGMDLAAEDALGIASAYDRNQTEEGASAQLEVVRLFLRHGAPIGPATRGDALDSLTVRDDQGRGKWAHKLCGALVEHCRQIPRRRRRKDITAFLGRLSDTNKRLGIRVFDIDFV